MKNTSFRYFKIKRNEKISRIFEQGIKQKKFSRTFLYRRKKLASGC